MPKKKPARPRPDLDTQLASELRNMQQIQANIAKIQAAKQQQLDQRRAALRAQIDERTKEVESLRAELKALDTVDVTKSAPTAAPVKAAAKKPGPKPGLKKKAADPAAKPVAKAVAKKAAAPKAKAVAKKAKKAAAAPKKTATAKKPAPKKAAAAAKPSKSVSSAVAEGRRAVARGDRPPMKEAIARVMGKSTLDAATVIKGLTEKGWLPNTAPEKTQQYISYILSSSVEVFERIERGKYKVKDGVTFVHKTRAPKAKAAPAKAALKKETPAATPKIDSGADIDALPDPFSS
jgi:cell division protein FtsB